MNIAFVEISNFRKLKACRVEISEKETILVGANNSGKTSAMDSLILFLKRTRRKEFSTTDFTLSNWSHLDDIGLGWVNEGEEIKLDFTLGRWMPHLPAIDVWIKVEESEIHHVVHLLPTLDWKPGELLGVRLMLAPKNIEKLYKEFRHAYESARRTEESSSKKDGSNLSLWPKSMREFLDRELHNYFEVKAYILDPDNCKEPTEGVAKSQRLPGDSEPLDRDPFDGLFKIDVISAQRGFSDPKTEDDSQMSFASLASQLRQYFTKHLDPSEAPDASDIDALKAIEEAKKIFDERLKESFTPAIGELQGLNYPGFSDPQISLTSRASPVDSLVHKTVVKFELPGTESLSLPEQYNGLGYQNLISMVFNLIRFRDEWMRVGKAAKKQDDQNATIEPLHIVLIEEPEAHLHAQVQQVFIKKAYDVLRNHDRLASGIFSTQMIVSTHSSHIAHQMDFTCLRYFRREPAKKSGDIPSATVVNLSNTFGDHTDTSKFATRYIQSTHCDLFFADAAIIVEGSAERILVPHFIRNTFHTLDQNYISLLEIGGSHAHRLQPLLETLGLLTLIITDLDAIESSSRTKVLPERDKGYRTGNTTLKKWVPQIEELDALLNLKAEAKQTKNGLFCVAYQCPIKLTYKDAAEEEEAIPYTFEDSIMLTNLQIFKGCKKAEGLLKKLIDALGKSNLSEARTEMFNNLGKGSKAEMALELLYLTEPSQLRPPTYISDGLRWLETMIEERKQDVLTIETEEDKDA